jgi:hypothetical protein
MRARTDAQAYSWSTTRSMLAPRGGETWSSAQDRDRDNAIADVPSRIADRIDLTVLDPPQLRPRAVRADDANRAVAIERCLRPRRGRGHEPQRVGALGTNFFDAPPAGGRVVVLIDGESVA